MKIPHYCPRGTSHSWFSELAPGPQRWGRRILCWFSGLPFKPTPISNRFFQLPQKLSMHVPLFSFHHFSSPSTTNFFEFLGFYTNFHNYHSRCLYCFQQQSPNPVPHIPPNTVLLDTDAVHLSQLIRPPPPLPLKR